MCILLLSKNHPDYDLILLSNRDEFFARPTQPLARHTIDASSLSLNISPAESVAVIAGLDAQRGGTWLALAESGRFSALTNFHVPDMPPPSPISRGHLPLSFLTSSLAAKEYAQALVQDERINQVGGFSLLCGDLTRLDDGLVVVGNQSHEIVPVLQGSTSNVQNDLQAHKQDTLKGGMIEGDGELMCACELSNTSITTPWPKTQLGKRLLEEAMQLSTQMSWSEERLVDELFNVLQTDTIKKKEVAGMRESIFIPRVKVKDDWYGTRQQTVWLVKGKNIRLFEQTISSDGSQTKVVVEHQLPT